jgi:hypothetical protein
MRFPTFSFSGTTLARSPISGTCVVAGEDGSRNQPGAVFLVGSQVQVSTRNVVSSRMRSLDTVGRVVIRTTLPHVPIGNICGAAEPSSRGRSIWCDHARSLRWGGTCHRS